MTSIAKDRPFERWAPDIIPIPLAAGAHVFYGTIVAVDSEGFGVSGMESPDLTYAGAARATVDNSGGEDGELVVQVQRPTSYALKWVNDGTITQAHLLATAYILDNQTVTSTDGGGTRSPMGQIVRIEHDGVWVQ
ncbi:hypothetical protein D3880_10150 [Pseudomonas cavernae]|uniref:Uncharacterized protein n=1 Tax=Pseudomonas cavernae TaxID=2320867 RepID=A0A385Z106_9PSED|nr:hypothetical protein [Pseudomonas cavernae]AYC32726.1 hypothetical protein D3880_10150 [Pseudomonas cavernae]